MPLQEHDPAREAEIAVIPADTLQEGLMAASYVRFCDLPLDRLEPTELLAAAGHLFIEITTLQQRLEALTTAIAEQGLSIAEVAE
jgi:hypothetical protein